MNRERPSEQETGFFDFARVFIAGHTREIRARPVIFSQSFEALKGSEEGPGEKEA